MSISLIQQLLEQTDKQHSTFAKIASEGVSYYQNNSMIKKTGAASIDEVNSYLKKLGKNPLKSADNRIPTNWHKVFTDQKTGYLFTYPPQFDTDNSEKDKPLLDNIKQCLGKQYPRIIKQLCLDASNTGVAWLTYWHNDKNKKFDYYYIDPVQIRAIYDSTNIKPVLQYVIREYEEQIDSDKVVVCELWSDREMIKYHKSNDNKITEVKRQTHTYGRVPFIRFANNSYQVNDLSMYKEIIDSIDKVFSGFMNDIDDLQEIIWVIKNYAGETNKIDIAEDGTEIPREIDLKQKLKAEKLVSVDADGGLDAIKGEVPYEARTKALEMLFEQMFISAMAVNPNPERTGQATGSYIDFLFALLELKAGLLETEFRVGLDELLQAILTYLGKAPDTDIEQIWTRNKPRNESEIVDMLNSTPNEIMSDESKTKVHPLVEDWGAERDRIAVEQNERAKNHYDEGMES